MTQAHRSATASAQLSGERMFMTQAAARALMQNPVQVTRGQITRISLIVPAFESPNRQRRHAYLVAHIPQARVRELLTHLGTLAEAQRAGFVRSYIIANQQAMISTYLGNRRARFRFNAVAPSAVASAPARATTPRRTARPTPRRSASPTPRRATPPAVATPQPREAAVPTPRRRSSAPRDIEVTGGSGSRRSPFILEYNRQRATTAPGNQRIDIPLQFALGGSNYRFSVQVTLNQIANSRIQDTYTRIIRACRAHLRGVTGGAVRLRSNLPGFRQTIQTSLGSAGAEGRRFLRYLETH